MTARLRRARPADAAAVARVMRAAIRATGGSAYGPAALAAWSSLPALYHRWAMTAGGEDYLVAVGATGGTGAGRVVAYAARRGAELTAAFVHPRAARRGLGRALVERLAREAVASGHRRLVVLAALPAAGFYSALGFAARRPARVPLPDGLFLDALEMARPARAPRGGASRARAR